MSRLRCVTVLPSLAPLGFAPLAVAILLGGCASTPSSQAAGIGGPARLEADGLPAQVYPARDIRQLPDDSAEPFSANYGRQRSGAGAAATDAEAIIAAAITAHEMRKP